eukprot:CAMPEP_0180045374 /NCGR_PEP_ID=MMETSP0984-20121128/36436_1 /TAXON_ID=483367 /ORGANISM="non described non described, Strain CCMP 2436" /LENGTH=131 /DNA_ID=CAMNT_0021973631 /DNA_START=305 /DNA_END=700 /DNA_ORIENTATION=+
MGSLPGSLSTGSNGRVRACTTWPATGIALSALWLVQTSMQAIRRVRACATRPPTGIALPALRLVQASVQAIRRVHACATRPTAAATTGTDCGLQVRCRFSIGSSSGVTTRPHARDALRTIQTSGSIFVPAT